MNFAHFRLGWVGEGGVLPGPEHGSLEGHTPGGSCYSFTRSPEGQVRFHENAFLLGLQTWVEAWELKTVFP